MSIVNNCGLERKGTLSFDFYGGACTVLNTQTIVLCFDLHEQNLCRHADNPLGSFTKLKKSRYEHWSTKIASYDGKILFFNNYNYFLDSFIAVGQYDHNHVEMFTMSRERWETKSDYPYSDVISRYSILTMEKTFIIFGGEGRKVLTNLEKTKVKSN